MKFFHYQLPSREAEDRYRRARIAEAREHASMAAWLVLGLLLAFLPLGWWRLREWPDLILIESVTRGLAILGLVVALVRLRRVQRWEELPRWIVPPALLVWVHLFTVHVIEGPSAISLLLAFNILAVPIIFTLLPLRFSLQAFLSGLFSGGTCLWAWSAPGTDAATEHWLVPVTLLLAANGIAAVYSIQMRRSRRTLFSAHEEAEAARLRLDAAVREREATISAKNQLFAIISHDLRNPIGTMVSIGELLTDSDLQLDAEVHRDLLSDLASNARTTYLLLDNLLNWAQTETGEFRPQAVVLAVDEVVRSVWDLLELTAEQKGVRLHRRVDPKTFVRADPRMLHCVLRNLLSNAVKFTRSGRVVTLHVRANGPDRVHFAVIDEGVGIAAERLERLFEEGYGETTPGTEREAGSGLGLRLSHRFVALSGGRLTVESEVGVGSTFAFDLPV